MRGCPLMTPRHLEELGLVARTERVDQLVEVALDQPIELRQA